LLDTLIVRSLMTPSIAAILGPWFWWPLKIRQRPAYSERMRSVPPQRKSDEPDSDDKDTEALAPA
jgi:putative drug exporter of the RND superfamily